MFIRLTNGYADFIVNVNNKNKIKELQGSGFNIDTDKSGVAKVVDNDKINAKKYSPTGIASIDALFKSNSTTNATTKVSNATIEDSKDTEEDNDE